MANVVMELNFVTTLTQKEFSVMTRALAGHDLNPADEVLAIDLNKRLLKLRRDQLRMHTTQASRALEVAEQEAEMFEGGGRKAVTNEEVESGVHS